jgi:hypothetical protein
MLTIRSGFSSHCKERIIIYKKEAILIIDAVSINAHGMAAICHEHKSRQTTPVTPEFFRLLSRASPGIRSQPV